MKKRVKIILEKSIFILEKVKIILENPFFILANPVFILTKHEFLLPLKEMMQNPILWLQTITKSHLSHHYILKIEQKFMVFTSKPVLGLKNTLVSTTNIRGKLLPQYICEKIHHLDPQTMVTKTVLEAGEYYTKNQEILQKFIEQLSQ